MFAGSVLGLSYAGPPAAGAVILAGLAVAAAFAARLARSCPQDAEPEPAGSALPRAEPAPGLTAGCVASQRKDRGRQTLPGNRADPNGGRSRSRPTQESLLAGWPVSRLWAPGLAASFTVASSTLPSGTVPSSSAC